MERSLARPYRNDLPGQPGSDEEAARLIQSGLYELQMLRDHSQERRVGFTRAEIFTHLDTKHGKRVVARFRRAADMLEERGVVTSLRVGREIDWTYWLPPQGIRSEEERKVRWVTKVFRQITDPKAFADNVVNAGVITLLLTVMLQILGGLLHLLGISG